MLHDPLWRELEPQRINLSWVVRLRWATLALHGAGVLTVAVAVPHGPPLWMLISLLSIEAATNIAASIRLRRAIAVVPALTAALMGLDMALLTGLLYLTGGPTNPFGSLYLVQISLAAIVLPPRWTWALVALALLGSATLFLRYRPLELGGSHAHHMVLHMQGMWLAFGLAATFIVYFLMRVTRALAERERELADARQREARHQRLASLATLAAGAAHELATPLGTIAIVAAELQRRLGDSADAELMNDVALVRAQVNRCREILAGMATDAGKPQGEPLCVVAVTELLDAAVAGLPTVPAVRVEGSDGIHAPLVRVPPRALTHGLRALIKNAQQASPDGCPVDVRVVTEDGRVVVQVHDIGAGMDALTLAQVGEPFFTTKAPGRGMGLGVFLARTVIEHAAGRLAFASAPGQGTQVRVELPLAASG